MLSVVGIKFNVTTNYYFKKNKKLRLAGLILKTHPNFNMIMQQPDHSLSAYLQRKDSNEDVYIRQDVYTTDKINTVSFIYNY